MSASSSGPNEPTAAAAAPPSNRAGTPRPTRPAGDLYVDLKLPFDSTFVCWMCGEHRYVVDLVLGVPGAEVCGFCAG